LSGISYDSTEGPEKAFACDLIENRNCIELSTPVSEVRSFFDEHVSTDTVTIIQDSKPVGLLQRSAFLTCVSHSNLPDSATLKLIEGCIEKEVTLVDSNDELLSLGRQITKRPRAKAYDDFIVCDKGEFLGSGSVYNVMRQLVSNAQKAKE
jgi:hypothetical protein